MRALAAELLHEHGLISEALSRLPGGLSGAAIRRVRDLVDRHHRKEEGILFPALVRARPDLGSRIGHLHLEHARGAALFDRLERGDRRVLGRLLRLYADHIADENRIFRSMVS